MVLALPDVTLCAVSTVNHELTVRAIQECLKHCSFADVVLLSDKPVDAPFRVELIPTFEHGGFYSNFICRELTKYTPSKFNLIVQYDGYIIEPRAWSNQFLDYDYIGAKWPWHPENCRVGNSGFCLRSKKLLDILSTMDLPPAGTYVDDVFICHTARDELEKKHGIKIAPEAIADRFSYERHKPTQPSFGFHGLFNFWRHIDDAEMEAMPYRFDYIYVASRMFVEVMFCYYDLRKFRLFAVWYNGLRIHMELPQLRKHFLAFMNNSAFIDEVIQCGEKVRQMYGLAS